MFSGIPVVPVFRYHDQFDNPSPTFCGEVGAVLDPSNSAEAVTPPATLILMRLQAALLRQRD